MFVVFILGRDVIITATHPVTGETRFEQLAASELHGFERIQDTDHTLSRTYGTYHRWNGQMVFVEDTLQSREIVLNVSLALPGIQ